jgi:ABC-2 type transport system permease protein
VVMLPAAAFVYFMYSPSFSLEPWALCLLPIAILMGFLARFCFEWVVALSAFWTTRTTAVNRTYYSIYSFLSGRVAPLALLPAWLGESAQILPFYSFVGFPVELAIGKLDPQQALLGLGVQLFWVLAALLAVRLVWSHARRTFSAVGS